MDDFEKKCAEYAVLAQKSHALAAKASAIIGVAGVLQEAINLNQQLAKSVAELVEVLTNERKAKSPDADGRKV